jgi:hypothetical protein
MDVANKLWPLYGAGWDNFGPLLQAPIPEPGLRAVEEGRFAGKVVIFPAAAPAADPAD